MWYTISSAVRILKKCQFCFYDCVFILMCVNLDELPVPSVCCIIYNNHIFLVL